MDEAVAIKVLKEVKLVFDACGVEFWLNFGGLLGAVREGRFIPYDDDIELNAWAHKVTEKQMGDICRALCARGYNAYYSTLTDYIIIEKWGIPISFSMFTLEGDKATRPHEYIYGKGRNMLTARFLYYLSEMLVRRRVGVLNRETFRTVRRIAVFLAVGLTKAIPNKIRRSLSIQLRKLAAKCIKTKGDFGKTVFPARFYLELKDFTFYGETFRVPRDIEEYLQFVYGPDWRIPIKDWNFYDVDKKPITGIVFADELWDYK